MDVNVGELHKLIVLYGDVLEWGAGYYAIQKLKGNELSKIKTPTEGVEAGLGCIVDFMRQINKEIELKKVLQDTQTSV